MSTLILSGWTQPPDALAHLVEDAVMFDYSEYASPDDAIEALRKLSPAHAVGWSMGGQLALRAIAAGAIAPEHLTLIAVPYRFVGHNGMDTRTFDLFRENYATDATRSKERFHALIAKGDSKFKQVMGALRHHTHVENTSRFLPWLDDLAEYSLDAAALAHAPRTLIIHGMNDVIVPHAQSDALKMKLPNATVNSWAGVGHAPHLHDADRLKAEIDADRRAA